MEDAKTLHFAREQLVELLLFVTEGCMGFLILPIKNDRRDLVTEYVPNKSIFLTFSNVRITF